MKIQIFAHFWMKIIPCELFKKAKPLQVDYLVFNK